MSGWVTVLAMGAVTYGVRLAPILLLGRIRMPPIVLRALRYVPAAVLSAIVFPELFLWDGALAVTAAYPRLIAGIVAALVAWRTRNMLLTVIAGMAALWGLNALLG